ncbi:MAG TPA: hypothetical protein VIV40_08065, partial [Kofleriaceae bacterium]
SACTSDDPAPSVEVLSATPDRIDPANDLADDVRIVVAYDDGDGDLGEGIAQVHDCRAEALTTELAIPAIAGADMIGSRITGSMDLYITDVGAAAPATMPSVCTELGVASLAADQTVFCVVLVDAKQHAGAGDCTEPITLAP